MVYTQVAVDVKGLLKERFKIKELGPISWILGIAVERDFIKGTLIMHQQKYNMDIVERFGMENADAGGHPIQEGMTSRQTTTAQQTGRYTAALWGPSCMHRSPPGQTSQR